MHIDVFWSYDMSRNINVHRTLSNERRTLFVDFDHDLGQVVELAQNRVQRPIIGDVR